MHVKKLPLYALRLNQRPVVLPPIQALPLFERYETAVAFSRLMPQGPLVVEIQDRPVLSMVLDQAEEIGANVILWNLSRLNAQGAEEMGIADLRAAVDATRESQVPVAATTEQSGARQQT